MKLLLSDIWLRITNQARNSPKAIAEHNRKALIKAGKQQFEKLKEMGLSIPVNIA